MYMYWASHSQTRVTGVLHFINNICCIHVVFNNLSIKCDMLLAQLLSIHNIITVIIIIISIIIIIIIIILYVFFHSAQKPLVLIPKLFECSSSLSVLVVSTMAQCLNLLVDSYPHVVRDSLLKMVHCVTDTSAGGVKSIHSLKLLIQLMLQSPRVLGLAAGETLRSCELIKWQ